MNKSILPLASACLALSILWPAAVLGQPGSWQAERDAAVAAYWAGDYAAAEQHLLSAIDRTEAFGLRDPRLAATLNDLALTYFRLGRYADAEPLHLQALKIRERVFGPDHPLVAATLNDLAFLYVAQGRTTEAEPLHKRALEIREKAFGPEHPEVAKSLNNIGSLYLELERYVEAEALYRQALGIVGKTLGEEHPYMVASLNNLAALYDEQGRYPEAEPLYHQALGIAEKTLGGQHPQVAASLNNLALHYDAQGKLDDAEPLYRKALGIVRKTLGDGHPDVAAVPCRSYSPASPFSASLVSLPLRLFLQADDLDGKSLWPCTSFALDPAKALAVAYRRYLMRKRRRSPSRRCRKSSRDASGRHETSPQPHPEWVLQSPKPGYATAAIIAAPVKSP